MISPPSKKEYPEFFNINIAKIYDKNKIANSFNQFFTNIGHNLAEQISTDSNLNYGDFLLDKTESRLHFETVSEDYVSKLIKKLPNKSSCGYDNISLKLIKYLNTLITPPITTIINQMINTGIFPDSLKIAKVKPIFKKNDTHTINNYRPISLLPSVSKIFEKIIYHQTYSYFQSNNLFFTSQYGFRAGHSTEHAAIEIVDKIIKNLDMNELPINIYLDLSKAFNTLDHSILIQKLKFYGVEGNSLKIFQNYLSKRKQFVEFENVHSEVLEIDIGVP